MIKKLITFILLISLFNLALADSTIVYTQAQVDSIVNSKYNIQDTTITQNVPQAQTIIIQQQNNNNPQYGWDSWSDGGKAFFVTSMVILTLTAIIVPIVIVNQTDNMYDDIYDDYSYTY